MNNYDQRADIWSLGCIIAEMMIVYLKSMGKIDREKDHNLFKGSSCNPISPMPMSDPYGQQQVDSND